MPASRSVARCALVMAAAAVCTASRTPQSPCLPPAFASPCVPGPLGAWRGGWPGGVGVRGSGFSPASPPGLRTLRRDGAPTAGRRVLHAPQAGLGEILDKVKRGKDGRPRLLRAAEALTGGLLRLCLGNVRDVQVSYAAQSNRDVLRGRLGRAEISCCDATRLLKSRALSISSPSLDLRYKPLALAGSLAYGILTRSLGLGVISLALSLLLVRSAPGQLSWTCSCSEGDARGGFWGVLLQASLGTIMKNSVIGAAMAAASAQAPPGGGPGGGGDLAALDEAVGYGLQGVSFDGDRVVFEGEARMSDSSKLSFTMRSRMRAMGRVVSWENPELKVAVGWPLPDFWIPVISDVAYQLPPQMRLDECFVQPTGDLRLSGVWCIGGATAGPGGGGGGGGGQGGGGFVQRLLTGGS